MIAVATAIAMVTVGIAGMFLGMRATFSDAGHILGSASVTLECVEGGTRKRIVFSGDVGRNGLPIIRDPKPPTGGADVVILDRNPLDNIRNSNTLTHVVKNGRVFDANTLAEIHPTAAAAPRFYWQ